MKISKTRFDLREIRDEMQGEEISELVEMLDDYELDYSRDGTDYILAFERDLDEEHPNWGNRQPALWIEARDPQGTRARLLRYPTNTDSFYDSCMDVVNKLRNNPQ